MPKTSYCEIFIIFKSNSRVLQGWNSTQLKRRLSRNKIDKCKSGSHSEAPITEGRLSGKAAEVEMLINHKITNECDKQSVTKRKPVLTDNLTLWKENCYYRSPYCFVFCWQFLDYFLFILSFRQISWLQLSVCHLTICLDWHQIKCWNFIILNLFSTVQRATTLRV